MNFLPKTQIKVAVSDNYVDQEVETVPSVAKTDRIGYRKIFVSDLSRGVSIRTEETDGGALLIRK